MEIHTFINAKINRETAYKLQQVKDGNYRLYLGDEETQEYSLFDKDRFQCFLEKEIQILNDEFNKL